MEQEKDRWVDEALESTRGLRAAEPLNDRFAEIWARARKPVSKTIPLSRISAAAACLLLLVSANFLVIKGHERSEQPRTHEQSLQEYYDLNTNALGL